MSLREALIEITNSVIGVMIFAFLLILGACVAVYLVFRPDGRMFK